MNAERPGIQNNRAEAGSRAEKSLEWASAHLGTKPERSLGGGVAETGQRAEQGITSHGTSVIVAALIFIPRVANTAVIAAAQGLNDGQSFFEDRKSTTSELQSHSDLVCRLLLEKKKSAPLAEPAATAGGKPNTL